MTAGLAGSFVADLHVHSPYAFACSKSLTLDNLASWAQRKGIDLLATGTLPTRNGRMACNRN